MCPRLLHPVTARLSRGRNSGTPVWSATALYPRRACRTEVGGDAADTGHRCTYLYP